jgi:hypothetical protein
MKPKFNWAGQSLINARKLAEARKIDKQRKKKVYNAERYADPVYREAILEKQKARAKK